MYSKKLFVGICNSQDDTKADFTWSWIGLKLPCEIAVSRSRHPWDIVRNNRLIKQFLDSGCDIFVKMDIDQAYPSDYFLKMLPLVEEYKVIGPLIYDRWEGNGFIPLAFENNDYRNLRLFDLRGKTGIVDVPYPHTNLFYHREVLEKVPMPWYEAIATPDGLDRANHVDFTFLKKIRDVGYPIYINTDVEVDHLFTQRANGKLCDIYHRD